MKSLITIKNVEEAELIRSKNIEVIDIKNPESGSLGCPTTESVKKIVETLPNNVKTSIALGDFPNIPGTASMAVKGCLSYNTDFIKIGMKDAVTKRHLKDMLKACIEPVKNSNRETKLVAATYADIYEDTDYTFQEFIEIAKKHGFKGVMIDTLNKDKGNLLDHLKKQQLREFVEKSRENGLLTGLAGSLRTEDIEKMRSIENDYVGVRGALCKEGRNRLDEKKTEKFLEEIN